MTTFQKKKHNDQLNLGQKHSFYYYLNIESCLYIAMDNTNYR
jgi:hypothetical protein